MGKEGDGRPAQGCQADQSCKEDKLPRETDNNNLLWVARVLELIYNDKNLQVPKFKKGTEVPAELKKLEKVRISGSLKGVSIFPFSSDIEIIRSSKIY